MNEPDEIKNRLRDLADSVPRRAGADSEQRLLSAFRAHHRRRKSRRTYIAQAAGLMIVGVGLYFALARHSGSRADGAASIHSSNIVGSQNGDSRDSARLRCPSLCSKRRSDGRSSYYACSTRAFRFQSSRRFGASRS